MSYHAWPDRFGMIIAAGCAFHCATITVMFLLYPALWLNRRYWEIGLWQKLLWLEWGLLGATWVLVVLAMTFGWRQHRRSGPATLATVALLCLSLLILTPLHFFPDAGLPCSPWSPGWRLPGHISGICAPHAATIPFEPKPGLAHNSALTITTRGNGQSHANNIHSRHVVFAPGLYYGRHRLGRRPGQYLALSVTSPLKTAAVLLF